MSLERPPEQGQGFDGWARGDRFYNIENITGTAFGDILIGNAGDNVLIGGSGSDILMGRAGNDVLDGGAGVGEVYGNRGDDTIYVHDTKSLIDGGQGFDEVITTVSRFTVDLAIHKGIEAFRLSDTGRSIDPNHLTGSSQSDILIGNWKDNTITGDGAGDTLFGLGGDDRLEGGTGNDTYVFGAGWGRDVIFEDGGRDTLEFIDRSLDELRLVRDIGVNNGFLKIYDKLSDDCVVVSGHFTHQTARVDALTAKDGSIDLRRGLEFEGTHGRDALQGTIHNDYLRGLGDVDTLRGDSGADFLEGGAGNDNLEGGEGDDTYVFRPGFGHDTISEAGRYLSRGDIDSPGDTIAFYGIAQSAVNSYRDTQGRQFIEVLDLFGGVTDSIFIPAQASNYGDGLLVEWMSFDGGGLIPIL